MEHHLPELFDTHAHIFSPTFTLDEQPEIIRRARLSSIVGMMNIATSSSALHESVALKSSIPDGWILKIAACTTPHDAKTPDDMFFTEVSEAAHQGIITAIGETGLDYHYHGETKELQLQYFQRYASLAAETHLPLIVHSRDAFPDVFALMKEYSPHIQGIIHCFTGTAEEALAFCDLGYYISISGIVTFGKASAIQDAVTKIPLDRLLIETDSPYLAPEPYRGKRNEPSFLPYVARKVAQLRNVPLEEIAEITLRNAQRLIVDATV